MGKRKARTGPPPRLTKSIASKIEKDWIDGQGVGDRLPSVRKLAAQYEVSQRTVLSAMEQLQKEFKVAIKTGSGAFVTRNSANKLYTFEGKALGASFGSLGTTVFEPYRIPLLEGLAEPMRPAGLSLQVPTKDYRFYTTVEPKAHFDWPNLLGLFLIDRHRPKVLKSLRSLGKPLLGVDHDAVSEGVTSCCFDNHAAGEFLARRLIKLGHRRVGMLFEALDKSKESKDSAWESRREGFLKVCAKNRLDPPVLIPLSDRGRIGAPWSKQIKQLIAPTNMQRCTAIFVATPYHANEVHKIVKGMGLAVPRDLTLVTCSDASNSAFWTGIRFDFEGLGLRAGNRMLAHLSGERLLLERPELILVKGVYFAGDSHGRVPKS